MKLTGRLMHTDFGESTVTTWESEQFFAGLVQFQGFARLTIMRADKSDTPMSWEELQGVKSACGFSTLDAVEVYPRDCDVINTGNARHLYLFANLLPFAMRIKPGDLAIFSPEK